MTTPHPNADLLRAIADGKQMQGRVPEDGCDWFDIYPDQAIGAIASDYSMDIRIKPGTVTINGIECPAPMRVAPAAQPPAGIWVPTELAERVQETMGEFLMDHDWRQTDMDTADAFGALLAAAPKAAPAPDLELTDAQIFDIAADPATCPAPPWWHRDEVAAGDVRKAVLAFARAIIRASRGQAPAPASAAKEQA